MVSLALFPIRYALVGPGPQILILWLLFITLQLTQCGATTAQAPVLLCGQLQSLPWGRREMETREGQAMDSHEVPASQGEVKEENLGSSRVDEAP